MKMKLGFTPQLLVDHEDECYWVVAIRLNYVIDWQMTNKSVLPLVWTHTTMLASSAAKF